MSHRQRKARKHTLVHHLLRKADKKQKANARAGGRRPDLAHQADRLLAQALDLADVPPYSDGPLTVKDVNDGA